MLSAINTELSKNNINILAQYLKTNEEIGYVVLDVDKKLSAHAFELLKDVKETIKVDCYIKGSSRVNVISTK